MPRKIKVSSELLQSAMEAARMAQTADELRMAQAVIFPSILGVSDLTTAKVLGRSRGTVLRFRNHFKQLHSGQKAVSRNWGGRRYGYMTLEEERQFLSGFLDQASHGGVLIVSEIKRAFEKLVGRRVAKTTIYRMLDRHDWRKIMPRPHHPKTETNAQEGFKKTAQDGEPMR